ncbi:MAG: GreA/GreB family elongation factor [Puniceicoccales bacterium]|jgi:transcription elongation GreA/GreB family factor|nr:GreA/GreB family elongation factor [Puniceicoccales bacterium]
MDEKLVESLLREDLGLQRQREKLEALRRGAFCFHRTFGFGEVVGYDGEKRRLLIDFAEKPGHAIDPAFAVRHLEILPEDHILVRFRRDGAAIRALVQDDPAAALRLMLAHSPDQRATQGEINVLLAPILGEGALRAWWLRAKKLAESDPCIAQPENKTGYYALREQPLEQLDELIDGVLLSRQAAKKIQCAAKILSAKKSEGQREKLLLILEELEKLFHGGAVSDGERLQLLWLCEDFSTALGSAVAENLTLTSLLRSISDLTAVADGLSAAQLNRLLGGVKRAQPEEYRSICTHLLRNGNGRTVGATVDFLLGHGHGEEVGEALGQWLRDNTLRSTPLDWILRNRHQKKYTALLAPLVTVGLFRLALVSIDQEALRRSSNRKIALAETIAEDRLLIEEITLNQPQETVRDLAHMVLHSQAFDTLTKKSIVARFIRLFPALQDLLDSEGGGREEAVLCVSQASLDAIRGEYEALVQQKIPANKLAVEVAREQGDLRENSEYRMARQDQDMLLARKAQIEKDLARVRVLDFDAVNTDAVAIGCVVTLVDSRERQEKFAILGAWDSNPERRILAYPTPFGRALLGKKVGESVAIEGQPPRRVVAIGRWVDHAASW